MSSSSSEDVTHSESEGSDAGESGDENDARATRGSFDVVGHAATTTARASSESLVATLAPPPPFDSAVWEATQAVKAEAAAKAGNAAVKPGAHIAASSTPQPNSQPQYKPPKKKRAINIDLPKDVIHRLRRQRAAFNRHREITEAALLNSGMRQYQIIELLADDIAVGLVKNIVDELEKGVEGEAERILEIL